MYQPHRQRQPQSIRLLDRLVRQRARINADYVPRAACNDVGYFTAENLVAILRALPKTDGTYRAVVAKAREHGGDVPEAELARWIAEGTADIRAGNDETAYARFTRKFDELKRDRCGS